MLSSARRGPRPNFSGEAEVGPADYRPGSRYMRVPAGKLREPELGCYGRAAPRYGDREITVRMSQHCGPTSLV